MNQPNCPCVLTIAGSDSSGGAGIQADIKAISATGSYAASVITVLTAQNTQGVQEIQEIPVSFVDAQINSVFDDLDIRAVKIGMLFNQEIIEQVAVSLQKFKPGCVILDPVMISKSGKALLLPQTVDFLKKKLFPHVTLITPNLYEAEEILGLKINSADDQAMAAFKISDQFKVNTLVKGGHFTTEESSDVVYFHETKTYQWFHAKRIKARHTHGTGCSLSAAIASFAAQGYPLNEAIAQAKAYLTKAIECADDMNVGKGCGPVNHFYFLKTQKN